MSKIRIFKEVSNQNIGTGDVPKTVHIDNQAVETVSRFTYLSVFHEVDHALLASLSLLRYARKLGSFACVLCEICVRLVNIVHLSVFYYFSACLIHFHCVIVFLFVKPPLATARAA